MNEELISVIVLAYNIEEYIIECLESIKKQTYSYLEVIIINDGSTDNTLSKIEMFCSEDSRFNFYSKKNGGPSSARNYGMEKINGKYFVFVDGDDILDYNCINLLYTCLKKNKADISICGFEKFYMTYNECKYKLEDYVLCREEYYKRILNFEKNTYVWGILYPKKFKEYISFPNCMYFEDLAVFPSILEHCNNICYINSLLVKYRQNSNSIVHVYNQKKIDDYLFYADFFCKQAKKVCKNVENLCNRYLANAYMTAIYLSSGNNKENIKYYKKRIKDLLNGTRINDIKGSIGAKFRLFKISPDIGSFFLTMKKRCIK